MSERWVQEGIEGRSETGMFSLMLGISSFDFFRAWTHPRVLMSSERAMTATMRGALSETMKMPVVKTTEAPRVT